jgi:hypothetical protein
MFGYLHNNNIPHPHPAPLLHARSVASMLLIEAFPNTMA